MSVKNAGFLVLVVFGIWACNNDDDNQLIAVPPRDLSEVVVENNAEIQEFLNSHFYNYEEFQNPPANFDFKIVIDSLVGTNSNKIPLSQQVVARTVNVSSFEFGINGEEDVEHTYYYLEARAGEGVKPTVADSVFVNYQGSLLNGTLFDNVETGTWWANPIFQSPLQRGFTKSFRGVAEGVVNTAGGVAPTGNADGTFGVEGTGIGMIILPSGLANFNITSAGGIIPSYTPIIFKYELLVVITDTDHDQDGIPSRLEEDENIDGFYFNDDTDGDFIANFQDIDDDNDGVLTIDEINLKEDGSFDSFRDTDGDGILDHLDNDL